MFYDKRVGNIVQRNNIQIREDVEYARNNEGIIIILCFCWRFFYFHFN